MRVMQGSAAALALTGGLFLIVAMQGFVPSAMPCLGTCPDHIYYLRMADQDSVPGPFAYRIISPLIASLISFPLLTFLSLSAFLTLLYLLELELGARPRFAVFGLVFAAANFWVMELFVIDPYLVDPLGLALITACCLLSVRGEWPLAILVLGLAVVNKESGALALIPLVIRSLRAERGEVAIVGLCVVFAGLTIPHVLITPSDTVYGFGASMPSDWLAFVREHSWDVWGPLILLAPLGLAWRNADLLVLALAAYLQQ